MNFVLADNPSRILESPTISGRVAFFQTYQEVNTMIKEVKTAIIEQYRVHETDTGSPEVQIAMLTERINHLNEHLKIHKKDHHSDVVC